MAWRVTEEEVREIVDHDVTASMKPFIDMANSLTNQLVSKDSGGVLNSSLQKQIEKLLSAHYYSLLDKQYESKKTGDASAKFTGEWGKGLDGTSYGQAAKELDLTGYLAKLGKGSPIKMTWLGRPPSEQTDYVDRD